MPPTYLGKEVICTGRSVSQIVFIERNHRSFSLPWYARRSPAVFPPRPRATRGAASDHVQREYGLKMLTTFVLFARFVLNMKEVGTWLCDSILTFPW